MVTNSKRPDILYHYTSLNALFDIIKGAYDVKSCEHPQRMINLRATHINYLNDISEGDILIETLGDMSSDENKLNILKLAKAIHIASKKPPDVSYSSTTCLIACSVYVPKESVTTYKIHMYGARQSFFPSLVLWCLLVWQQALMEVSLPYAQ